ncbi:hypothetical protein [Agriterribacter sp.]|uniref:hypothetical protein n=1 Tax=Agriterribacter sp. TaxID=2821509 RepID=UPI002C171CC9|nr:hypothetical protein [Agriterribacter sp.]HRP55345.1 hypothetical protein [Agriterribacter sp.]
MDTKYNESTSNRPKGERVLDAPFVMMDIPAFTEQLRQEKAWQENDRNGITVFKSDSLTIVISILKTGAQIKDSPETDLLTAYLLNGEAKFITHDNEEVLLNEKQSVVFHRGMLKYIEAASETTIMLSAYEHKNE